MEGNGLKELIMHESKTIQELREYIERQVEENKRPFAPLPRIILHPTEKECQWIIEGLELLSKEKDNGNV